MIGFDYSQCRGNLGDEPPQNEHSEQYVDDRLRCGWAVIQGCIENHRACCEHTNDCSDVSWVAPRSRKFARRHASANVYVTNNSFDYSNWALVSRNNPSKISGVVGW